MKMRKHFTGALALVLAIGLAGCQSMPKDALMLGPESLANRQLQTRRFDGLGEKETLAAGAGVFEPGTAPSDNNEPPVALEPPYL